MKERAFFCLCAPLKISIAMLKSYGPSALGDWSNRHLGEVVITLGYSCSGKRAVIDLL